MNIILDEELSSVYFGKNLKVPGLRYQDKIKYRIFHNILKY